MSNILEYKGYHTKVDYDSDSNTLRGVIEGINDYVDFEADNISNVVEIFHSAVDDYLDFCKEVGKEPEKEYRGTFNIRIDPELHRNLALCAYKNDCSLNSEVEKAISMYIERQFLQTRYLNKNDRDITEKISVNSSNYKNEKTVNRDKIVNLNEFKQIHNSEVKSL